MERGGTGVPGERRQDRHGTGISISVAAPGGGRKPPHGLTLTSVLKFVVSQN